MQQEVLQMFSNKINQIVWQKWVDPFGEDEFSEIIESLTEQNKESEDDEETYYGSENTEHKTPLNKKHIKVIATPLGIIPLTENTASGKIFNFWMGHTNFNITQKVASIIERVDGVESLDIFTRYRFRISVGKAFIDSNVMRDINDEVYSYLG